MKWCNTLIYDEWRILLLPCLILVIHELQVRFAELLIRQFKLLALVQLLLDSDALLNEFKQVFTDRDLRLNNLFVPDLVDEHHLKLKRYCVSLSLVEVFLKTRFKRILKPQHSIQVLAYTLHLELKITDFRQKNTIVFLHRVS